MKSLDATVRISSNCFYGMLRNFNEKHKDESLGLLIGGMGKKGYYLENFYPIVTSKSTPCAAWMGNASAWKRIVAQDQVMKESGSLHSIIGGYHTHVFRRDEERFYIGRSDIDFFRGLMEELELDESVQLVATIRIKEYSRSHAPGEQTNYYGRKARIIFNSKGNRGHDIILAGYKLTMDDIFELKVRRENLGLSRKKK